MGTYLAGHNLIAKAVAHEILGLMGLPSGKGAVHVERGRLTSRFWALMVRSGPSVMV